MDLVGYVQSFQNSVHYIWAQDLFPILLYLNKCTPGCDGSALYDGPVGISVWKRLLCGNVLCCCIM